MKQGEGSYEKTLRKAAEIKKLLREVGLGDVMATERANNIAQALQNPQGAPAYNVAYSMLKGRIGGNQRLYWTSKLIEKVWLAP